MRCRLILLISEHPIQQGIRKGGVRHFCDEDGRGRTRTDRMAYSRQLDENTNHICDNIIVSFVIIPSLHCFAITGKDATQVMKTFQICIKFGFNRVLTPSALRHNSQLLLFTRNPSVSKVSQFYCRQLYYLWGELKLCWISGGSINKQTKHHILPISQNVIFEASFQC